MTLIQFGGATLALFAFAAQAAPEPYPSTYHAQSSTPVLIRNATVLDGTGRRLDGADVLIRDGNIVEVGTALSQGDATAIDAKGRWVTPGLIDVHSHLGVYASPGINATDDGNEATDPVTAGVWAEHSVWPQDPGFATALAGGVTMMQILPGSANLIGGRGVTLRNVPATTYQAMKFPGAPQGLKMACGENPKRVYGERKQALGIADRVGTLEPGKIADVVLWNRDPFSVYARPDLVYIDGALAFDRSHPPSMPRSDFLLGQPGAAR